MIQTVIYMTFFEAQISTVQDTIYVIKCFGVTTATPARHSLFYMAALFLCPDKMYPHRQSSFHNGSAILPQL